MLFIVADDADDLLGDDGAPRPKAQLDDSEASRAARKVDLDLDDAPFLEDEEEEEEAIDEAPPVAAPALDTGPKKEKKPLPAWLTNKFLYIGIGVALALFLGIWFLFLRPGASKPTPKEEPKPEVVEQAKQPEVPPEVKHDNLVKLDPFLIEAKDKDGQTRFLEISLVFATPDQFLADNLVRLTPTVRYALYYYMHSKDLTFLTDEENSENLKKELLAVVNQYMSSGRYETVLFEEYVVK